MSRLPTPGSDNGSWGDILNDYLSVAHASDGTIKPASLSAAGGETTSNKGAADGYAPLDSTAKVPTTNLGGSGGTSSTFLRGDQTWAAVPAASDATTSSKGIIQLAGDLAGTASAPTVPGLAGKQAASADLSAIAALTPANDDLLQRKSGAWTNRTPAQVKTDLDLTKTDVGLGNVDNTSDPNKPVSTAQQIALDLKVDKTTTITAGTGLTGGGDLSANRTLAVSYGTTAGTAVQGNDSRLTSAATRDVFLTSMNIIYGAGAGSGNSNQPTGITMRASFVTSVSGSGIRFHLPAWTFTGGNDETALNENITYKASLVTASNSKFYPLAFDTVRSAVTEGFCMASTRPLGLYLPKGTQCVLRVMIKTTTSSGQWPQGSAQGGTGVDVSNDGFMYGDVVDSGTFTPVQTNIALWAPIITCTPVVAGTQSWVAVGDSLTSGQGDSSVYRSSWFTRAINQTAPAMRLSGPSDTAQQYALGRRARSLQFATYATHAVIFIGSNDLFVVGRTLAQTQADLISGIAIPLWKMGKTVYLATILPRTNSTDSWATLANQTTLSAESSRVSFNTWVRAGAPLDPTTLAPVAVGTPGAIVAGSASHPATGYIETANTVESSQDSGKWAVNGTANYLTADGAHATPTAAQLISAALSPLVQSAS